jgi:hypothetical protein
MFQEAWRMADTTKTDGTTPTVSGTGRPTNSQTLVIENAPGKLLLLAGVGIVMTATSIAVFFLPGAVSLVRIVIGGFGTVFFGLCTGVWLWRLFRWRTPVVTISPEGIRDTRIAAEMIPWSAVTGISTWQFSGQKVMVLAMRPDVEDRLGLARAAHWSRGANRALGADGLCVRAAGLKIDYDSLLQISKDYANAQRQDHRSA